LTKMVVRFGIPPGMPATACHGTAAEVGKRSEGKIPFAVAGGGGLLKEFAVMFKGVAVFVLVPSETDN